MINWNEAYKNIKFVEVQNHKKFLYDMIIGELNRISVSDDFEEKENLYAALQRNIIQYYDACCRYTSILLTYDE